jgi:predicted transcriptional regulator
MSDWRYDSSKTGLETVFFDYEIEALHLLWSRGTEKTSSREVWMHVNSKISISRASIINSLNRMVKRGILDYKEESGKGGMHGLYSTKYSEPELRKHIAKELIENIGSNLA